MTLSPAQVRKNQHKLAAYDRDRVDKLREIEVNAFANFSGTIDELEAAIGVLHLGDHVGWRPLVIVHNKRTLKKYEEILNINLREFFPEQGPSAERLRGYVIAKKLGNFWKAVNGEVKDEELKAQRRSVA